MLQFVKAPRLTLSQLRSPVKQFARTITSKATGSDYFNFRNLKDLTLGVSNNFTQPFSFKVHLPLVVIPFYSLYLFKRKFYYELVH